MLKWCQFWCHYVIWDPNCAPVIIRRIHRFPVQPRHFGDNLCSWAVNLSVLLLITRFRVRVPGPSPFRLFLDSYSPTGTEVGARSISRIPYFHAGTVFGEPVRVTISLTARLLLINDLVSSQLVLPELGLRARGLRCSLVSTHHSVESAL